MPKPFIHPDLITEQMFLALEADIARVRSTIGYLTRGGDEMNANVQTLVKGGDVPTVFGPQKLKIKRKEITIGALPNATTKQVAHGISNLGTVVSCRGYAKDSTSGRWINIPQ